MEKNLSPPTVLLEHWRRCLGARDAAEVPLAFVDGVEAPSPQHVPDGWHSRLILRQRNENLAHARLVEV